MKIIYSFVLILISVLVSGQINNPQAKELFDKGILNYEKKQFEISENLFSQSIAIEPSLDAIYYRALSNKDIGKTCKRCKKYKKDMKESKDAASKYSKECWKKDSITYEGSSPKGIIYYCLVYTKIIESKEKMYYYFCRTNTLNRKTISFYIKNDSTDTSINPIAVFPNLDKMPSEKIEYYLVDELPKYIGGDEARIQHLIENIHYPQDAKENGYSGTVYVTFIIDEKGMVKDVKLLRGFINHAMMKHCVSLV